MKLLKWFQQLKRKNLNDCYINGNKKVWKTKTLIEKAKYLQIFQFPIKSVSLKESLSWKLETIEDFCSHLNHVRKADLTKPIILAEDGCVMHGKHKVMKAICYGVTHIPAKQFRLTPKCDFKLDD